MPRDFREAFGEPLFVYTRAQALADGVLLDVSARARHLGCRFPVALTQGVYAALTVQALTPDLQHLCVDLLLLTLHQHIRTREATDRIDFTVKLPHLPPLSLYALCGPGDTAAPVLTVLLPHED